MLLTISTNHQPATNLGYLLHKNPARQQTEDLSFGKAYVFYPKATSEGKPYSVAKDVFHNLAPRSGL